MLHKIQIQCPNCGDAAVEVPSEIGTQDELALRVEFLEAQLHRLMRTNMSLRHTLCRVIR